jgi:Trypsin-like peptidase domain
MKAYARLALVVLVLCPNAAIAQRAIPDDNLAYPVQITLSDCDRGISSIAASGFFLDTGTAEYLVTARHVLFNESQPIQGNQPRPPQCNQAALLSYSRNPKERIPNRFVLDLRRLWEAGYIKAHTTHDVAAVKVGVVQTPATPQLGPVNKGQHPGILNVLPGVALSSQAPSGILTVSLDTVMQMDSVLVANDIYIMGYPSSIGIRSVPQIEYEVPLIRKGIVSAINYNKQTIILDCFTAQGNSGGPVLEVTHEGFRNHFSIIGVVSQFVPAAETWENRTLGYYNMQFHNSGYTVAEPMDFVLQLVGK